MVFSEQGVAVTSVLYKLGSDQSLPENERPTGFGSTIRFYNHEDKQVSVSVQIDLV